MTAAATCIILLPPSSFTTLSSIEAHLTQTYPSRTAEPQWSLTHAAYRAVVPPSTINGIAVEGAPPSLSSSTSFSSSTDDSAHLHVLSLSTASSSKTFIHTYTPGSGPFQQSNNTATTTASSAGDDDDNNDAGDTNAAAGEIATIAVPKGPDTTSFSDLLVRKMAPLWTAVKQLDLVVKEGQAWNVGAFEVLAGEVRPSGTQQLAAQTHMHAVKGTVVAISLVVENGLGLVDDASEPKRRRRGRRVNVDEEALLREFAATLGLQLDETEHFWGHRYRASPDSEVALWCRLLRSRALIMPGRNNLAVAAAAKR